MHAYTTDEARTSLYAAFAVIAVGGAWGISALTSTLTWPEWVVSAPSLAGVYVLVYKVFDVAIWRLAWVRNLGVVAMRDIRGRYEGTLTSTFVQPDGSKATKDVAFEIRQTWTRISIEMTVRSGSSTSRSTSALGSLTRDGDTAKLVYTYQNKVNPGIADDDMGDHEGAAELLIYPDGRLEGRYFNSRPRAGTVSAQLVPR